MIGVAAAAKVGGLVDAATEIFGSATNSENAWVTGPTTLVAVKVIRCVPPVPAAGVPVIVAVPLVALGVKVKPAGSADGASVSVTDTIGAPLVVTVKLNGEPTCAVAVATLVKAAGRALIVML